MYLELQDHPLYYAMWVGVNLVIWQELGLSGLGEHFFTVSIFIFIVFIISLRLDRRYSDLSKLTPADRPELLGNSLLVGIVWAGCFFTLIYFSIFFHHSTLFPFVDKELLLIAVLSLIPICINIYCVGILSGLRRFSIINLTMFLRCILLLAGVIYAKINSVLTLELALSFWVSVEVVTAFILLWRILIHTNFSFRINLKELMKDMFGGLSKYIIAILFWLLRFSDLIVLIIMINFTELGQYVFAVLIVGIIWRLPELWITGLTQNVDKTSDQLLVSKSLRIAFTISSLSAFFLLLAGWLLSVMVFGLEFDKIYLLYLQLVPGAVMLSQSRVLLFQYNNNSPKTGLSVIGLSVILILALGLCISTNIVLIPRWGAAGAAFAFSISQLFMTVILISNYRRLINGNWSDLFILKQRDLEFNKLSLLSNH